MVGFLKAGATFEPSGHGGPVHTKVGRGVRQTSARRRVKAYPNRGDFPRPCRDQFARRLELAVDLAGTFNHFKI